MLFYLSDLKGKEDMLDDVAASHASSEGGDCIEESSEDSASEAGHFIGG